MMTPSMDPEREFLAAAGEDGRVVIWDIGSLREKYSFQMRVSSEIGEPM